jgi:hypothetical protein
MVIGFFIVNSEPAVHVLNKQVEDVTAGAITQKSMLMGLSVAMSLALGLTMVRILLGIPFIYILLPAYGLSLILLFFVPRIFAGIAFDSGGVCAGAMTSAFLLPLAKGVTESTGGDMMRDAFGIVAMVAVAPLVVVQIMGVAFGLKLRKAAKAAMPEKQLATAEASAITDFGTTLYYRTEE